MSSLTWDSPVPLPLLKFRISWHDMTNIGDTEREREENKARWRCLVHFVSRHKSSFSATESLRTGRRSPEEVLLKERKAKDGMREWEGMEERRDVRSSLLSVVWIVPWNVSCPHFLRSIFLLLFHLSPHLVFNLHLFTSWLGIFVKFPFSLEFFRLKKHHFASFLLVFPSTQVDMKHNESVTVYN